MTSPVAASQDGMAKDVRQTWTSVGTTLVTGARVRMTCPATRVTVPPAGRAPGVTRRSMSVTPTLVSTAAAAMTEWDHTNVSASQGSLGETVRSTLMTV